MADLKNKSNNSNGKSGNGENSFLDKTQEFFHELVDLRSGLDREGTIVNIKNNRRMVGANAWLLMCSIMIASLGLDLNSPAVIIGAMLISPLMSPILGVGLGVGISDEKTVITSLKSFGVAIAIALVTSTLYFLLTPFGNVTDEILARTKPTLLDVLVATFGGIAGIISGSRKDQSNAIPGVAIATALMPPLCVTGFGIATGNWLFMTNSFYLFFLNATFVALATLIIVRYLDFPRMQQNDLLKSRRTRNMIGIVSFFMILPSMYILYSVILENRENRQINTFLNNEFGNRLDTYKLISNQDGKHLILKVYGNSGIMNEDSVYQQKLDSIGIKDVKMNIIPTSEIDLEKIALLEAQMAEVNQGFQNKIEEAKATQSVKDQEITMLRNTLDSLRADTIPLYNLSREVKVIFPTIKKIGYANTMSTNFENSPKKIPTLLVDWRERPSTATRNKLTKWMQQKFDEPNLEIINY